LRQCSLPWLGEPADEFWQGDEEGSRIDFFEPVVAREKMATAFRALLEQRGYTPARGVLDAMTYYFEDPDGNFVQQFHRAHRSSAPLPERHAASAEGEHIRSFQMMARRLRGQPALARILIHRSGPLTDYPAADVAQYAEVFRRGIEEVDRVTAPVVVRA